MKINYIFYNSIVAILLFTSFPCKLIAQSLPKIEWHRSIGGSKIEGQTMSVKKSKKGYIICTWSNSSDGDFSNLNYGMDDAILIEIDEMGNILRKKNIGGSVLDIPGEFIECDDGSIIMTIQSWSNNYDFQNYSGGNYIVNLDSNWNITYLRNYPYGISNMRINPKGDFFGISGSLISFNKYGMIDQKRYSPSPYGSLYSSDVQNFTVTKDSNLVIALSKNFNINGVNLCDNSGKQNLILNKTKLDFTDRWIKSYCDVLKYDYTVHSIFENKSSEIISVYNLTSTLQTTNRSFPTKFLKIDSNGSNILEKINYFSKDTNNVTSISKSILSQKGVACLGMSYDTTLDFSYSKYSTILLSEVDTNFNILWEKKFGGSRGENPLEFFQTDDGGFMVFGNSLSTDGDMAGNHGDYDIFVMKISGFQSCPTYNKLNDTIKVCGTNVKLDAGPGFKSYLWSTKESSQNINVYNSGNYRITVMDSNGCKMEDSTFVSLIKTTILNSDTLICKGNELILNIDSSKIISSNCNISLFTSDLVDNLTAYYSFCGNAFDVSGNSNNGINYNTSLTEDRFGNKNSALYFNGVNSFLQIPTLNSQLSTISLWFKTPPENRWKSILKNNIYGSSIGINSDPTKSLKTQIYIADINNNINSYSFSALNNYSDDKWHHCIISYDSLFFKIYIDGTILHSDSSLGKGKIYLPNPVSGITIGRDGDSSSGYFLGSIDDVAIFSSGISDQDVFNLYKMNTFKESYLWSTGDTVSRLIVSPTVSTKYSLYVNNGISACSDSIAVSVPYLDTSITALDSTSVCSDGTKFARLKAGNGMQYYKWKNNGKLINGEISQIYKTYNTGNYYALIQDNNGCIDSSKIVSVDFKSQPNQPIITPSTKIEVCIGEKTTLRTNSPQTIQWYKDEQPLLNAIQDTLIVNQSGQYKVKTENKNGCSAVSNPTILVVNNLPSGSLNQPSNKLLCEGSSIQLTALGGSTYQWYLDNIPIPGETKYNSNASIAGSYSVELINEKGCKYKLPDSVVLSQQKKPKTQFESDSSCANQNVFFTNNSIENGNTNIQYYWDFGDGTNSVLKNPTHTYTTSGIFTVKLFGYTQNCPNSKDSVLKKLKITQQQSGIKYPTLNLLKNVQTTLSARSIGVSYLWIPNTGLSSPSLKSTTFNPTESTSFKVIIKDTAGCTTVDTQFVNVSIKSGIYVPEAFSPNNDGHNDRLFPICQGIKEFHYFRIFNRWGNLVFETLKDDPNNGWEGSYKGQKQPLDTYTWIAEGVDLAGNIIRKSGSTVLIR